MIKILEYIMELTGWLRIVASPFLAGTIIGGIVFYYYQNYSGLIIGILLSACGLIIGIVWATRIWKRQGTNRFLSRIMASPELDTTDKSTE